MFRTCSLFFFFLLGINILSAQTDAGNTGRTTRQSLDPLTLDRETESEEIGNFERKLAALKSAFEQKESSKLIAFEAYIVRAMRVEVEQLTARANLEAAQTQVRKSAGAGQLTQGARVEDAPARDPFAEATTPTEIRLEKMQYIAAAFERHAFDPSQTDAATRDFAKLDAFLQLMREDFSERFK